MTPLARLIDAVKAANDWSDPRLVENAREQGHELTKSNISRYRNDDPLISIKGAIVEALAAGLRVSPSQVAVAAVESMGIALPSYELPTVEQAIRLDATLAERDRQILIATVREIREQGSRHADQPPTPASPPATPPRAPLPKDEKTRAGDKPADLNPEDQASNVEPLRPRHRRGRNFDDNPIIEADAAAYDPGEPTEEERRDDGEGDV